MPMNKHGGGHLDHGGTTGLDGVSATTATATSSSTRHTSRWSEPSSTGADIVVAAQAGLVLVRVDEPINDIVDKLRRETSAGASTSRRTKKTPRTSCRLTTTANRVTVRAVHQVIDICVPRLPRDTIGDMDACTDPAAR